MATPLARLADRVHATLRGDGATPIAGVAGIQHARPGEIALLAARKFARFLDTTAAAALVVATDFDPAATPLPLLICEHPEQAFEAIAEHFAPAPERPPPGVHPTAVVHPDAHVAPTAAIGACCVVEPGARIGDRTVLRPLVFVGSGATVGADCTLHPHVAVLDRCVLGDRVVLHSGVVIGADGFGYEQADGVHRKLPQRGIVEVGDDVEIGANTTVDRARFGRTVLGAGTKIDNLAQIAHNVHAGPHCLIVAQAGVAGSVTLGHHVVLAAQAGIKDHVTISERAIVGAQAGVNKDPGPGAIVLGSPAQDIRRERRAMMQHQRLPDLAKQVRRLDQVVQELQQRVQQLEAASENDPGAG